MTEIQTDLREELNRKTLTCLEQLISDRESGAVDVSATKYALQLLFCASSGLLDNETVNLVSELSSKVRETQPDPVTRLFGDESGLIVVSRLPGADEVMMRRVSINGAGVQSKGKRMAFGDSSTPVRAAAEFFTRTCESLQRKGHVEL